MNEAYPLSALLRVRRQIEQRWQQQLALALAAAERAAGELAQARQRLASLEREIGRQQQLVPVAPAPIAGCQRRNRFVEHLRRERGAQRHLCDEARCRHDRASGAVSEARERLAQAAAASAQVEQHRRDWDRARWRAEQRRAEEELEELTTARVARERG